MDAAQIAALLQQSNAAHRRYRDNSPSHLKPGNATAARAALEEAARLRSEADAADPTHSAPAWQQETVHTALTEFYRQELAK